MVIKLTLDYLKKNTTLFPLIFISVRLSMINVIFSANKSSTSLQFGKNPLSLGVTLYPSGFKLVWPYLLRTKNFGRFDLPIDLFSIYF